MFRLTPQDYFYICPVHLKDRGFCSPIVDEEEAAAKKKKEEMDSEIEKVKQEYEEKMRKKKSKEKKDDKKGEKKDDKKGEKKDDGDAKEAEKERDDKACVISKGIQPSTSLTETIQIKSIQAAGETKSDDGPRIFALHKYVTAATIVFISPPQKRNEMKPKEKEK